MATLVAPRGAKSFSVDPILEGLDHLRKQMRNHKSCLS